MSALSEGYRLKPRLLQNTVSERVPEQDAEPVTAPDVSSACDCV